MFELQETEYDNIRQILISLPLSSGLEVCLCSCVSVSVIVSVRVRASAYVCV